MKIHSRPDYLLMIFVTTLIVLGIIYTYSLSAYIVIQNDYPQYHFLIRQFGVGVISICIMWFFAHYLKEIHIHYIGISFFVVGIFTMALMPFLPSSLVSETGGASRWIKLPLISISPVEFFKIGFIYFLSWSFKRKIYEKPNQNLLDEFKLLMPYFLIFGIVIFLVAFLQKDLGQVVVLGLILIAMMIFSNRSMKLFGLLAFGAILVVVMLIIAQPHRINRFQSWWVMVQDFVLGILPESMASYLRVSNVAEPYQVGHSLNAIANGGFFGTGIGEGFLKKGFLPEIHTDFVLAGIAEEGGWIGLSFVVVLIALVVWRIFRISVRAIDESNSLFTLGIGMMIAIAFIINSFGISGIIPIKGIAVPFLSYGGSSLLALGISIGMVLAISRDDNTGNK